MFCPHCGAQVPDSAKTCPACSYDLAKPRQRPEAAADSRTTVGTHAVADPRVVDLDSGILATGDPAGEAPGAGRSPRAIVIAAVAIVAVLAILVAVFAFGGLGPLGSAGGGGGSGSASSGDIAAVEQKVFSRDVVLSLDVSGSMEGDRLSKMKDASKVFVDTALTDGTRIGLISYSGGAQALSDLSDDREVLAEGIDELASRGDTNMEDGLRRAYEMLADSAADSRVIVLMSDGAPQTGIVGDELIAYADEIKQEGIRIYTIGLDESEEGHALMLAVASEGCHFEVSDIDKLGGFFADVASEVSGVRYLFVRVTFPTDAARVSVSCEGETLSDSDGGRTRTSFGTLTLEDALDGNGEVDAGRTVAVLRLVEGRDYDVSIEGLQAGFADISIGRADGTGAYEDIRSFSNVPVAKGSCMSLTAAGDGATQLGIESLGEMGSNAASGIMAGIVLDAGVDQTVDLADASGTGAVARARAEAFRHALSVVVVGVCICGVVATVAIAAEVLLLSDRLRTGRMVACCVLTGIAVFAAGGVILWQTGAPSVLLEELGSDSGHDGDDRQEVCFGSVVTVSVSRTARIVPQERAGTPLEHYVVYLVRAVAPDGSAVDVTDAERIEVSGADGFAVDDLLAGLADDITYFACVRDDEGVERCLPPIVPSEGGRDGRIDIVPPDKGAQVDLDAARASAYLAKILELEQRYGEPSAQYLPYDWGAQGLEGWSYIDGLNYAGVVDFGDGEPRLVVAYYDGDDLAELPGSTTFDYQDKFKVEVWEYDAKMGGVRRVAQTAPSFSMFGLAFLTLMDAEVAGRPSTYLIVGIPEGFGAEYDPYNDISMWGIADDGAFGSIDAHLIVDEGLEDSFWAPRDGDVRLSGAGGIDDMARTAQTALDTVAELQDVVDAAVAGAADVAVVADGEADGDPASASPVADVTGEEVLTEVAVPQFTYGEHDGTRNHYWGYVELSGGDPAAIDKINEELKADYDAELEHTLNYELSEGGVAEDLDCLSYRSALTYCSDGIAGIRIQRYSTYWGAHGGTFMESRVYDLATGEQMDLCDAVGMSEGELREAAIGAIVTYVRENPDSHSLGMSMDLSSHDVEEYVTDLVEGGSVVYLLTKEGVTVFTGDYAMGSFADGNREIVIVPFGDDNLLGTDVSGAYAMKDLVE